MDYRSAATAWRERLSRPTNGLSFDADVLYHVEKMSDNLSTRTLNRIDIAIRLAIAIAIWRKDREPKEHDPTIPNIPKLDRVVVDYRHLEHAIHLMQHFDRYMDYLHDLPARGKRAEMERELQD